MFSIVGLSLSVEEVEVVVELSDRACCTVRGGASGGGGRSPCSPRRASRGRGAALEVTRGSKQTNMHKSHGHSCSQCLEICPLGPRV